MSLNRCGCVQGIHDAVKSCSIAMTLVLTDTLRVYVCVCGGGGGAGLYELLRLVRPRPQQTFRVLMKN